MESSEILSDFLTARSGIEEFITLDQLSKLMKGQPVHVIESVYHELQLQRKSKIDIVERSIREEFSVPLNYEEISQELELSSNGKIGLNDLISKLHSLKDVLDAENHLLDTQIQSTLRDLQSKIDGLSTLKYGTSWVRGGSSADVESIVEESIESVIRCEKLVKKRKLHDGM